MEGVEYHIGRGVHYICLVGCKISPVDGYVTFYLILTIKVYAKGSQSLINALSESRIELKTYLTKVTPSQYLNTGEPNSEEKIIFEKKINLLNDLLDNKAPIAPFSGIQNLLLSSFSFLSQSIVC